MKLVFMDGDNNRPVTDSLTVAETFSKSHKRVMQDIRELDCSEEFRQHHFVPSSYQSEQNRELPKYIITEQGFAFLAMGYTGKEAARFKEMYIGEFNRMRGELSKPIDLESLLFNPETIIKIAGKWKVEQELRLAAERQIEQDKPKVLFADSVSASKTSILVGELAKILKQNGVDMGQNRLFGWLRDNGFLIRRKGTDYNMPTQRSMEMELFEIKETTINRSDGGVSVSKTPKVTGKGQVFFINKLCSST